MKKKKNLHFSINFYFIIIITFKENIYFNKILQNKLSLKTFFYFLLLLLLQKKKYILFTFNI
jgi:hypothetical protein